MTHSNSAEITASKGGGEGIQKDGETTYRIEEGETVTEAVVRAVSPGAKSGRAELKPLYSVIDTDALNALFAPLENGVSRRTSGTVEFDYGGKHVRVVSDGSVEVERGGTR
ncbi:HalOD1 output domain-containing protein [Halorussus amylolyticus]|uniref:HalOD1 output domain-containing protein n=1 Tax=Halorussus amylolyticus TaxID=1126242 RepID=UPI00138F367F|nr:HalOD1 output domain-containing protein [Halorussus amylolyticus]